MTHSRTGVLDVGLGQEGRQQCRQLRRLRKRRIFVLSGRDYVASIGVWVRHDV